MIVFGTRILIIWEIFEIFEYVLELVFGMRMTEAEVLEAVVWGMPIMQICLAKRIR